MKNALLFKMLVLLSLTLLPSCEQNPEISDLNYRALSQKEALQDFDQLVDVFNQYYGPMDFKEERFGYNFNDLAAQYRAKISEATSDNEYYGIMAQLIAHLDDGHINLGFSTNNELNRAYLLPLLVTPIDGKNIVTRVYPGYESEVSVGDEVLSVDGMTPDEISTIVQKYLKVGNPITNNIYGVGYGIRYRSAYMRELVPAKPVAEVKLKSKFGKEYFTEFLWQVQTPETTALAGEKLPKGAAPESFLYSPDLNKISLHNRATEVPFFLNSRTRGMLQLIDVKPNEYYLKKHDLDEEKTKNVYAGLFKHKGKNLLLLRVKSYMPDMHPGDDNDTDTMVLRAKETLRTIRAILDQYDAYVDGMVIDQTYNPGGFVFFVNTLFSMLIDSREIGSVQAHRADRKTIDSYEGYAREVDAELKSESSRRLWMIAKSIEKAYDAGKRLSEPLQFGGSVYQYPDASYNWPSEKPILILINAYSGSGGDAFPMLMKNSKRATLFGQRTRGLGGSVEEVATLTNSRTTINLTRGLFTVYKPDGNYPKEDWIENNGVQPDIPFDITVKDFRSGYPSYVKNFADAIVKKIEAAQAPEDGN